MALVMFGPRMRPVIPVSYRWRKCYIDHDKGEYGEEIDLHDEEDPPKDSDGLPRRVYWKAISKIPGAVLKSYEFDSDDGEIVCIGCDDVEGLVDGSWFMYSHFHYPRWAGNDCEDSFQHPRRFKTAIAAMRAFDKIMTGFTADNFWPPSRREVRGTAHLIKYAYRRCNGVPVLVDDEMWCVHLRGSK